jgi:hypothetical protein
MDSKYGTALAFERRTQEIPSVPRATERAANLESFGPKFRIQIKINVNSSTFVGFRKFLGISPRVSRNDCAMHSTNEAVNNFSVELVFVIAVPRKSMDIRSHLSQVGYQEIECPALYLIQLIEIRSETSSYIEANVTEMGNATQFSVGSVLCMSIGMVAPERNCLCD